MPVEGLAETRTCNKTESSERKMLGKISYRFSVYIKKEKGISV